MRLALTTLLVFALWSTASSDGSLYAEVQGLNGACSPLDSCEEFSYLRRRRLFWRRKCECGPHCVRFGTCCADSTFAGKFVDELQPNEECVKGLTSGHYWMVSKCDAEWNGPDWVVNECEREKNLDSDPLSKNMPVTNVGTLITYKNYWCALCNYGGDDFVRWKTFLKNIPQSILQTLEDDPELYVKNHIFYNKAKKGWVVNSPSDRTFHDIGVVFVLPSYLGTRVGHCDPDLVRKCLHSHRGTELEDKCNAYYMPIAAKNGEGATTWYKNVHCAMCNDVSSSAIVRCSVRAQQQMGGSSQPPKGILVDINDYGDEVHTNQKYLKIPDCRKESCGV